MNTGLRRGALFGSIAVLGAAFVAGCGSAPTDAQGMPQEKVASNAEALISTAYTPPPFPNGYYFDSSGAPSQNCVGKRFVRLAAYPRRPGNPYGDPHWTGYTGTADYTCNPAAEYDCPFVNDLWGIPSANGFRYLVQYLNLDGGSTTCTSVVTGAPTRCYTGTLQSGNVFYFQALADVDQTWSYYPPWAPNGIMKDYTPTIDSNSHPVYGSDYRSLDWKQLYNLVRENGNGFPDYVDKPYEAHDLECVYIYLINGNSYELRDFSAAGAKYDPNNGNW